MAITFFGIIGSFLRNPGGVQLWPMKLGIVVPWANVKKFGVAIFDIYLDSRIMRLIML